MSLLSELDVVTRELDRCNGRLELLMKKVDFDSGSYPNETYDRLADLKKDIDDLLSYLDTYSSYDPG